MSFEANNLSSGQPTPADPVLPNPMIGLGRLLVIYAIVSVLTVIVTAIAWDSKTIVVAILAAVTCCVAAVLGHFASVFPRGEVFRLARLYQSTAVRIALPVLLLLVCKYQFPELFSRGMVYFVFLFYLVGLLTEVASQASQLRLLKSVASSTTGSPAGRES